MPDDHSDLVPLLPIPNRTVKRVCADDSAGSRVKVGHRQAITSLKRPPHSRGAFLSVPSLEGTDKNEIILFLFDGLMKTVS